jgi:hypothetical protein
MFRIENDRNPLNRVLGVKRKYARRKRVRVRKKVAQWNGYLNLVEFEEN